MAIGEAPGAVEARIGRPLVGPSGQAFNEHLSRHGLSSAQFYLDNVVRLFQPGNPDPTAELIAEWTPVLQATIAEVRPRVIVTLGRFAARWFLGPDADMDSCHGIPHLGGEFAHDDASRRELRERAMGAVIVPSYHPAFGLHSAKGDSKKAQDAKALIHFDIGRAADVIRLVLGGRRDLVRFRRDEYAGREQYHDMTGAELEQAIRKARPRRISLDTEGDPDEDPRDLWLQVSWEPGTGYALRARQEDFARGVVALQELADGGCVFVTHDAGTPRGTGYDTQVSRVCGLELRDAEHAHTMYDAFLLRLEPKGLKPLLWRWCGMRQDDYLGLIGDIGRAKQIRYLEQVAGRKDWTRIAPRIERENNGVLKVKKFGKLESRAKLILTDIAKGKRDKDGNLTDPAKRWKKLELELRRLAEVELGRLPTGNLYDIEFDRALFYACRDTDGTGRLDTELAVERHRMGVDGVYETGCQVLPIFEEMQHEGMPASRRAFVDLAATVDREMQQIQAGLSTRYFDGRPFNPAPNTKDVETLVRRLGITGLKTTKKSGRPSTSMKSLEYLAPKYPALREVGEWRRRQKVLHTYCLPLIEIADRQIEIEKRRLGDVNAEGLPILPHDNDGCVHTGPSGRESDLFLVQCKLKPVSVETRRLAAEDPSLLNQPVRTELGRKVRACYVTVPPDVDAADPDNPNTEVFVACDFNSQEVRVTAHVTQDRLLCSIMRDPKRKIHMETASRIFGKPIAEIHEINEKVPAKTAFFGMLYGLSGLGLLDLFRSFGLEHWALGDCERLIAEIFRIYPGLRDAIRRAQDEARRTGMVRDLYGHIRYLPGIWSGNRGEQAEAGRQAFSHVIQGTAQGMTQCAMAALRRPMQGLRGIGVRWSLQVHDEVIVRAPRWAMSVVAGIMKEAMEQKYLGPTGVRLSVPVLADGHASTCWASLK
jgi:uracil-DNA glycosylase family 4